MCVCVGGGGNFFQSKLKLSEIPGGLNICYQGGGGGGVKVYSKGVDSNCLAIELMICTGPLSPLQIHQIRAIIKNFDGLR